MAWPQPLLYNLAEQPWPLPPPQAFFRAQRNSEKGRGRGNLHWDLLLLTLPSPFFAKANAHSAPQASNVHTPLLSSSRKRGIKQDALTYSISASFKSFCQLIPTLVLKQWFQVHMSESDLADGGFQTSANLKSKPDPSPLAVS